MSRTIGLTLLASSLLLAACGGSQPGGAGSTSPTTPATSTPAPAPSTSEPTSPATSSDGQWSTGKPVPATPTTVDGFTSLTAEQVSSVLLQKGQVPSGPWADAPAATARRPDPAIALLDRVHVSSPECGTAVQAVKAMLADQGSVSNTRAFTSSGIVPQTVRVAVRVASGEGALAGAAEKLTALGTACSAKIAVPDEAVTVRPAETAVKDAEAVQLVSKAAGQPTALAVATRGANTVIVSTDGAASATEIATKTLAEQVAQVEKVAG